MTQGFRYDDDNDDDNAGRGSNQFGKDLQIQTLPVPVPGRGEALVKVLTTGVCHTDLHAAEGDWPVKPTPPFIPGHEGVGEVVALGEGVADLAIGDLVGNAWLWSACGDCRGCNRLGNPVRGAAKRRLQR